MNTESNSTNVSRPDPPPLSAPIYKIANASLWCLVGSFAVNIFLGGAARAAMQQGMSGLYFAVTAATSLLFLLSIVFGAIALCGIPRYGKRRLLWKGLIGVFVPILLIIAAIPAFMKVRQMSEERARSQQSPP